MSKYVKESFDNNLFRVKHIAGKEVYNPERPTYRGNGMLILSYYKKGRGSIVIDSTRYQISGGELFIMKPTEFFRHNLDESCFHERIVLIIYPKILKNLPENYSSVLSPFFSRKKGIKNLIPYSVLKEHHIDSMFTELLRFSKEESDTGNVLAFSRVLEIMATANRIISKELLTDAGSIARDSKVNDILMYLNSNFTVDITVTDVAHHFNLDRSYISRLFKKHMGISIWDYVIMRRIYMYNFLIKDSDSIEETAYKVGFKNYSNFYRLYKKYMNMTPTEFKKSLYI